MTVVRYFHDIKQLQEITDADSNKKTRLIILRGPQGAGKTQAAFKFCWNCQDKYLVIAKLTATTEDSLIKSLKELANLLSLNLTLEPSDSTGNVIKSVANLLVKYFNHPTRSDCSCLMLIDDVSTKRNNTDPLLNFISSLFDDIKMLKFIITTTEHDLLSDFSDGTRQEIHFNGMLRSEYLSFFRKKGVFKEELDEDIDKLVETIGSLPLTLNSAREYMVHLHMSIRSYLEVVKESELSPEKYTKKSAIPLLFISLEKIVKDLKPEYENIREVIIFLRYIDYKTVWQDIIEVICRHFTPKSKNVKTVAATIVTQFLQYSLCHFVERSRKQMLSFHTETMTALKLFDKTYCNSTDCERLWFLVKMFCFEIDHDVRIDISLDRNILYLSHARKVIKELDTQEDNDNVTDKEKIKQRQVCLCYLHYVIGKTYLFQATDIALAHEHLMRARSVCLDVANTCSDLTESRCPYLEGSENIPDMEQNNLLKAFNLLCATKMGKDFAESFVNGKYRNHRDLQILRKASKKQYLFKTGYLSKEDYCCLSSNPTLALPLELISEGFLSELMLHIFIDNGRALDELLYVADDKNHVKKGRDFEFRTCIEFSNLMKSRDKFKAYPLLRYFAQDRGEQAYKLGIEDKNTSAIALKKRITDIRQLQRDTQKIYFQFGILKTSHTAYEYHNCQCYRLLLKFHQELYELSESKETLSEGRELADEFLSILHKMEQGEKQYKWVEIPKFYNQCAHFLLLSKTNKDYNLSIELFEKAINFVENRGVYLTRYLWDGYYGKAKCLLLLEREDEAKQISDQLRLRLEGTNQIMRINKLDELFQKVNI